MQKQYNVLLILTDQQRKDSLGCYGNHITETPNLDKLASEGVRFNRNYVVNPICMPNRLSIFTGMYPRNHGLWTNGLLLEHEVRTLSNQLVDNGYQTASFGKIHFTPYDVNKGQYESEQLWMSHNNDLDWYGPYWGFEHVELTLRHTAVAAHYGKWFREKGGTNEMVKLHTKSAAIQGAVGNSGMQAGTRDIPVELHDSTFVAERTVDFLKNRRDKNKPFFAVASFPDPHHPFDPPAEMAEKYPADKIIEPVGGPEDLETRPEHYRKHFNGGWHRKGYIKEAYPGGISKSDRNDIIACTYAMVDLIDQKIGEILQTLDKEGLTEDTLVIFTSDHGELLGDHGLYFKGPFFYDGLVNTPLIISLKGTIKPFVSDNLVSAIDLYPTICDILGIEIPLSVNGISQKAHLFDPNVKVRENVLIEYRNGFGKNDIGSKALVTEDYKYVRYQTGECELTDLKNDPKEKESVSGKTEYANVVNEMNAKLLDEILKTESMLPEQICHA